MITTNDIVSNCPLSERPNYVVFDWRAPMINRLGVELIPGFWGVIGRMQVRDDALKWANAIVNDKGEKSECLVYECSFDEAMRLRQCGRKFSDADIRGLGFYLEDAA